MGMYRIMATIQDLSGLPRDRYVNTLYVNTIAPFADEEASLASINAAVGAFYTNTQERFAAQVAGTAHTVKAYDMGLLEGTREPISEVTFGISSTGGGLPAEVALVLTLEAAPRGGVAPMSTKGRIFLGPLSTGTIASVAPGTGGRPSQATIDHFIAAGYTMMAAINAVGNASLVVASQRQDKADLADGSRQAYPVIALSMDNAWDTQRSRGNRATSRTRGAVDPNPGVVRSW